MVLPECGPESQQREAGSGMLLAHEEAGQAGQHSDAQPLLWEPSDWLLEGGARGPALSLAPARCPHPALPDLLVLVHDPMPTCTPGPLKGTHGTAALSHACRPSAFS